MGSDIMSNQANGAARPKVFISHAAADAEFVEREVLALLRRHGVGTWYSGEDIRSSEQWERGIRAGLESCDWFLVVMSPRSAESEWVEREVHWAMEERKGRVVPVVMETTDPKRWHVGLRAIQHVDFRDDVAAARGKLLGTWGHSDGDATQGTGRTANPTRMVHSGTAPGGSGNQAAATSIELTIDRDFDSFTPQQQGELLEAIGKLLRVSREIKVISVCRGSVKLTLALTIEEAMQLLKAVRSGDLEYLRVTEARILTENVEKSKLGETDKGGLKRASGSGLAASAQSPGARGLPQRLAPTRLRKPGIHSALLAAAAVLFLIVSVLGALWAGGVFAPKSDEDKERRGHDEEQGGRSPEAMGGPKNPERPIIEQHKNSRPPASFTNTVGMKLVLIPAGKALMGSTKEDQDEIIADYRNRVESEPSEARVRVFRAEGPRHQVELTRSFYLGAYEVTQKQFRQVMGYNPSFFSKDGTYKEGLLYIESKPAGGRARVEGKSTDDFPVENVSWHEAVDFCRKLTEKERKEGRISAQQEYRLPTEAEWEYSCRGGAASKPFHTGDSLTSEQANFDGNFPYGAAVKGPYLARTERVGRYPANAFGLHDMHGNVWEWCLDAYDKDVYKGSPRRDPAVVLPEHLVSGRVVRGGSWNVSGHFCRSACRNSVGSNIRSWRAGFRVALVWTNW